MISELGVNISLLMSRFTISVKWHIKMLIAQQEHPQDQLRLLGVV